ncbi:hypothetical protein J7E97_13880 [Streptomyces sp. ISL-66]|uniref:hypothetical protein n=1 Tax=Streptomyces sp. ISL-66 TaxID=2819186 RepID=UPI001BE9671E|nr:hypothetical protein [Streptomyces sp. ISL-66]MBT2468933.1 hypothetical protein [Streptomyces sp. ISL-66]
MPRRSGDHDVQTAYHRRSPYQVGDCVKGLSYVAPEDRSREQPQEITGQVVQIGAGWAGVDADRAYVWVRLANGRERQALVRDIQRVEP